MLSLIEKRLYASQNKQEVCLITLEAESWEQFLSSADCVARLLLPATWRTGMSALLARCKSSVGGLSQSAVL